MKRYLARLTPEYLKDAEEGERGINRFSLLTDPAIGVKGYYFSRQDKFQKFDEMKMRIASPAMLPEEIYRKAEDGDEEHEIIFDEEGLTQLLDEFMRTFKNEDLVNVDHTDEIAPAYIREIWQIQDPKKDRAFTEFGYELPRGTIFIIVQFTDRKYFEEIVKSGRTGISVEAFFERKEYKFKKSTMKKKRYSFNAQTHGEDGRTESGESIIVVATEDELKEGLEVVVVDEELKASEDYSGDVVIEGETVVITKGKIEEIQPAGEAEGAKAEEMADEEGKEKPAEEEFSDEEAKKAEEEKLNAEEEAKKAEGAKAEEMAEEAAPEAKGVTPEEVSAMVAEAVQAQMEEVYKRIGEIESKITQVDTDGDAKAHNFNEHNKKPNIFGWAKKK